MEFRIADTFTDSLSKLTAQEQKSVNTTAFNLQPIFPIRGCGSSSLTGPDRGQGHQPPRRRGDEGVQSSVTGLG